jgi:ribonuclease D
VASNLFTAAAVITKEIQNMSTLKEKATELAALLGDESLAKIVMDQAAKVDQAAQAAGVKSKEQSDDDALIVKLKAALMPDIQAAIDKAIKPATKEAAPDPAVAKKIEEVTAALKTIQDAIEELSSDQPIAVRRGAFRASNDPSTLTTKEVPEPKPDDKVKGFFDFALAGTPSAQPINTDIPVTA